MRGEVFRLVCVAGALETVRSALDVHTLFWLWDDEIFFYHVSYYLTCPPGIMEI